MFEKRFTVHSSLGKKFLVRCVKESETRYRLYSKEKRIANIFYKWQFLDVCEDEVFIENTVFKHFGYRSKLIRR